MNIAVIGLGLIGGSLCKSLKKHTFHHIMGIDRDKETIRKALEQNAIDEEITVDKLKEANLSIFVCTRKRYANSYAKTPIISKKEAL